MNTTSKSGSTNSSCDRTLNPRGQDMTHEDWGRRRWVATIAGVAVAAAGAVSVAAELALPSVLGGMNLGNHNETLLSAAVNVEPHERRTRH